MNSKAKKKGANIYIGTSGWHYTHWFGIFYPPEIKGYYELRFYAERYSTVENNSSFYRVSKESTYKTWARMAPEPFRFSMKLNKLITHTHRLELTPEVKETLRYVLESTQVLSEQLGALLIQMPPSFKLDLPLLDAFLTHLRAEAATREHVPDFAIEFRNKAWFTEDAYALLRKHNVALVAAQSSRYPGVREITADSCYIRMHGPEKLFASSYSTEQLQEWAAFIKKATKTCKNVYVYFNNDFHGYALQNAKELMQILKIPPPTASS